MKNSNDQEGSSNEFDWKMSSFNESKGSNRIANM